MKLISTRLHAGLDYLAALCMYGMAVIWRFDNPTRDMLVCVAIAVAIYAMLTRFEYSLLKLIPVRVHLALDAAASLVLIGGAIAFTHSLIGYRVALATFGAAGIIVAALSEPNPQMADIPMTTKRTPAHHVQ